MKRNTGWLSPSPAQGTDRRMALTSDNERCTKRGRRGKYVPPRTSAKDRNQGDEALQAATPGQEGERQLIR